MEDRTLGVRWMRGLWAWGTLEPGGVNVPNKTKFETFSRIIGFRGGNKKKQHPFAGQLANKKMDLNAEPKGFTAT